MSATPKLLYGVIPEDDPRLMEPVNKMLRDGHLTETIARITGVSVERVEQQRRFMEKDKR